MVVSIVKFYSVEDSEISCYFLEDTRGDCEILKGEGKEKKKRVLTMEIIILD